MWYYIFEGLDVEPQGFFPTEEFAWEVARKHAKLDNIDPKLIRVGAMPGVTVTNLLS